MSANRNLNTTQTFYHDYICSEGINEQITYVYSIEVIFFHRAYS